MTEKPPLYQLGDLVVVENKRRRRGDNPKLQAKNVGPYTVNKVYPNHTYEIERQKQRFVQNESRLKLYLPSPDPAGQAPATLSRHVGPIHEVREGGNDLG